MTNGKINLGLNISIIFTAMISVFSLLSCMIPDTNTNNEMVEQNQVVGPEDNASKDDAKDIQNSDRPDNDELIKESENAKNDKNDAPEKNLPDRYSIEQAISDNAQLNTIAFNGLGFLTGNICSDSFLPPGKVADFFGFQYLRDTTQEGMGHSTDFVTNAANNVLYILNDTQKAEMISLARSQVNLVNEFAYDRFPLMIAFRRQLEGEIPLGTSGLSKSEVISYSAGLYELDARISIQRAKLFSGILTSLNTEQTAYLDSMVEGGFSSWPALGDQVDKKSFTYDEHVLIMTFASEMFGWYAGNAEADTYFCPERQGNYFGGFYIKDAPAMGNEGYVIDESVTGDKGQEFIGMLDNQQRQIIIGVVDTQRKALNQIVETRREIATELRKALSGETIDEDKIIGLARQYGELDGEISYYYAAAFSQIGSSLTIEQWEELIRIKDLDDYPCEEGKVYLYSEKIGMPEIENTDFLFADLE